MFTQQDLDEAVAEGAMSPEAADSFRTHLAARSALTGADEEHFRLLTGFNDIFVSIAAVILLFSVGFIGMQLGPSGDQSLPSPLSGILVSAAAWGLALFFTARRRMALPSILLLLAFVGGLFSAGAFGGMLIAKSAGLENSRSALTIILAVAAGIAAAGAFIHWRRFKVPITVAAGAAALAGVALALTASAMPVDGTDNGKWLLGFTLMLGIGMFLFAIRWDSSDPARVTRRSDVAFCIHLLAAPMIVHPVFALLGLTNGSASAGQALIVIALYVVLGLTALAIDRRALLVSALAYVLFALSSLFQEFGAVGMSVALTALVIGSALLLLSAFWHQTRRIVVERLPAAMRGYLPATSDRVSLSPAA